MLIGAGAHGSAGGTIPGRTHGLRTMAASRWASTVASRSLREDQSYAHGVNATSRRCIAASAFWTPRLEMNGTLGNGHGRLLHRLGQRRMGMAGTRQVFGGATEL